MADASYTQTSFLGGEVSQFAQGQFDQPWYKTALARVFNFWPSDEKSLHRRPGTRNLGTTHLGNPGRLIAFDFSQATPYNLEITDNLIRMWNNINLVTTNDNQLVASISGDTPAVFSLNGTVDWQSGDTVYFTFQSAQAAFSGNALLNRQFILTMLNGYQFNVTDAITGYKIGAADNLAGLIPVVNHVLNITTTYNIAQNDWHSLRMVQGYNTGALLHANVAPQALQVIAPPTDTTFATFSFSPAQFTDGPYLDPPPNAVATPNSTNSSLQLTVGYPQWVETDTIYGLDVQVTFDGADYISIQNNNSGNPPGASTGFWQALPPGSMVNSGTGFQPTDAGRMIRLFYNPQIWNPNTTYAAGANVTYNGEYFTSLVNSNTDNEPDISLTDWVINTSIAYWTWGLITSVNAANNITVQLQGAILLDTTPILTWRLGAWSNTTGWPTCGCYQEGRFWYSGVIPNRLDSSMPNQPFAMAPTGQDGTVSDSNGISYTLNASENNPIFNLEPDHQGILAMTQEGEFLLTSGTTGTPMTPSNIQAHLETKYGSSNIKSIRTGLTVTFVKRYARRLMEYLVDTFSQRFFGTDLTQNARHLGARVIEEIDFQEELIPTIWARCADGSLIGTTYRRNSLFSTQPPEFNGWHEHSLGSGRVIESISVGPSVSGTLDALSMVTNDPATGIRFVEQMTTLLDETASVTQSWFLDTAITPGAGSADINSLFSVMTWGPGTLDAGMDVFSQCVQGSSVRPIVAAGPSNNPTNLWIGGFVNPGSGCSFQVENIAVNTNTPAVVATYNSATFSLSSPTSISWALDPTGRYIAMFLNNSTTWELAIFDTVALAFGTVLSFSSSTNLSAQIAWLDNEHLVVYNTSGTTAGVEAFSVSGTTITHVGYTTVWVATNSFPRPTLGYVQFLPNSNGNGLIHLATDSSGGSFSTIFGIPLQWSGGAVVKGSAYIIVNGLAPVSSSGTHWNAVQTNAAAGEWTLCYAGTVVCYLISIIPSQLTARVTRPWQYLSTLDFNSPLGEGTTVSPIFYADTGTFLLAQASASDNYSRASSIALDSNSFIVLTNGLIVSNVTALSGNFYTARLDSQRFLWLSVTGFTDLDISPIGIVIDPPGVPSLINFYGLNNFNGKKVSVFAAGIDCGDYVVENGQVSVPLGIADPETGWVFGQQNFELLQPISDVFTDVSVPILYAGTTYNIPCVIGFNYESQGQMLRPQMPVDTGAKNGPGFGKKRRSSKYAIQLVNAISVRVGTKLNKTLPAPLTKIDAGGQKFNYLDTFNGIMRDTLSDDFSYDSMLSFKITRPYPGTITAAGAFIETQDA